MQKIHHLESLCKRVVLEKKKKNYCDDITVSIFVCFKKRKAILWRMRSFALQLLIRESIHVIV